MTIIGKSKEAYQGRPQWIVEISGGRCQMTMQEIMDVIKDI